MNQFAPNARTSTEPDHVTTDNRFAPSGPAVWNGTHAVKILNSSRLAVASPGPQLELIEGRGPGRRVTALAYRPRLFSPDMPVVVVMHGISRDAWLYLKSWAEFADRFGFILLAPEFSRATWPGARAYNLGNIRTRCGADLPEHEWSFTAVDGLFEQICERWRLEADGYRIYGHSAGAQFVHRHLLHSGGGYVLSAVAANAGWYMFPEWISKYPYGLSGLPVNRDRVREALETPLTVLLGGLDDDDGAPNLRNTRGARRQGRDRLTRGLTFLAAARRTAEQLNCALNWQAQVIPNVAHSNHGIAPHACAALLGSEHCGP